MASGLKKKYKKLYLCIYRLSGDAGHTHAKTKRWRLQPLKVSDTLANQKPEQKQKHHITRNGSATAITTIGTHEESPARKVKTSSILVASVIHPAVAKEIKSLKQTLLTKDGVKQKGTAQKTPVSCIHSNSIVEFSENLHPGKGFSTSFVFIDLKICLRVDGRQNCIEKATLAKKKKPKKQNKKKTHVRVDKA